jgi:two-component system nitrate/nitrite sensor histidine kinase NarX
MTSTRHWSLGAKLTLVGVPFMLLVFISTIATLWVSWQLDGGAAAVNEAGRMRMQSYRMSLSIGTGQTSELAEQAREFDRNLATLIEGDPERPLFVPWDNTVRARFAQVERDWALYQARLIETKPDALTDLRTHTVAFASHIDAFVLGIAHGASNKQIARQHGIAETTVNIHVQHILRKLDVSSRVHAAVIATEHGLL